ncbi:hypothetical protein ScPMuIL_000656 [Solemya velum]
MRKSARLLSDKCRLLSLLLIILASVLEAKRIHGSSHQVDFNLDKLKPDEHAPTVVRYQLWYSYCSTAYLQIKPSRRQGSNAKAAKKNKLAVIRVESSGHNGRIRILGEESQLYLCFNRRGRLITKYKGTSEQCVFQETMTSEGYTKLQSVANEMWYVGFRKNGKALKGYSWSRSSAKEKCIQFLKTEVPQRRTASRLMPQKPRYGPKGVDFSKLTPEYLRNQRHGNS